jgi:hypothetical protein
MAIPPAMPVSNKPRAISPEATCRLQRKMVYDEDEDNEGAALLARIHMKPAIFPNIER